MEQLIAQQLDHALRMATRSISHPCLGGGPEQPFALSLRCQAHICQTVWCVLCILQEFFQALSLVRSRTFSGPYVASTLSDRFRLAGLVGGLVAVNTLLGGDLSRGLGAAAAVFLFNVIYEVVLSQKLRQYAMCPIIDLCNHSSMNTVGTGGSTLLTCVAARCFALYSPYRRMLPLQDIHDLEYLASFLSRA